MEITSELIEKAKKIKTVEELIVRARKIGLELDEATAQYIFEKLHSGEI
ncbi:MAG: hypothetical protein HUJ73_07330 [Eubacterium sp.]|mgnify:CR=1 FL=1|nr:hypothetical protein [Eubacterium sp.]